MQPADALLRYAIDSFTAGLLAPADIAAREAVALDPNNTAAWHLLGVMAAGIGARDQAILYLRTALEIEPDNARIRQNLTGAQSLKPVAPPKGDRYLLIKSWGFGFWADVAQLLGSLLLAEATGRIPVTYWGAESLFSDKSGRDAFGFYFELVSSTSFESLQQMPGASFFPPRWHAGNLAGSGVAKWEGVGSRAGATYFINRPEMIAVSDFHIGVVDVAPWLPSSHPLAGRLQAEIYRYLAARYLKPRAGIEAACETFLDRHIGAAPFVAVHMRGSDKALEDPNLQATNAAFAAALENVDPSWRILLLTDDAECLARMKERHGERLVAIDCQRTHTDEGVHYLPGIDPVRAGREVLTDACLALRANRFIGNGRSNVSAMIAVMKDWAPGDCTLIGPSVLMERNLRIHQIPTFAPDTATAGS